MLNFWLCIKMSKSFQWRKVICGPAQWVQGMARYLTPVTYVHGMSRRKMKPGFERKPIARKALGLRPRSLAVWNYPLGVKRLLKDFKQEIFFFNCMIHIVCTVGKTVYWNVKHPVKYCLPHTNDHCVWASSLKESPRWWLSTQFPEFPAPEGRFISAPFSKSPAFTLAVQWRIVAMSARSTGIQAGKEGNRDGGKTQIEKEAWWVLFSWCPDF